MAVASTTPYAFGITAVDTDYVRPKLDASHLIVERGHAAFVDTGTNHSVPLLLDALEQKNLTPADVDWVFLTHVHLDHAGGAGLLMQHLPNAIAVIHPRGARHMIDPAKLIKGAQAVYGEAEFAEMYGDIQPISAKRVIEARDEHEFTLHGRSFFCLYTEGHARHHYCLHDPEAAALFSGDSFGISYRELDTDRGEFIFPTTTPVHFDPAEAHRAVDRIMACEPKQIFLTHYSRVTDLQRLADDMHSCIEDFVDIATRQARQADRTAAIERALFAYLANRAKAHGVKRSNEELQELLGMDVKLNTQGLEHWLDHGSPTEPKG
ncbi:MAG: MBL fold metallo-hydrolase [Woeseia sp.]